MESVAAAIVSVLFKLLDKYVVYNLNSGLIGKVSLFFMFGVIEGVLIFSVLENLLEDLLMGMVAAHKTGISISNHLSIQTIFPLFIVAHSLLAKTLIWSDFNVTSAILIALLTLSPVLISILESYGYLRRFVHYEEKTKDNFQKQMKKQQLQQTKIKDKQEDYDDSCVIIELPDVSQSQGIFQRSSNQGFDTSTVGAKSNMQYNYSSSSSELLKQSSNNLILQSNSVQEYLNLQSPEKLHISGIFWVITIIYLILVRILLPQNIANQEKQLFTFGDLKNVLFDIFFIIPVLMRANQIQKQQILLYLCLVAISHLILPSTTIINAISQNIFPLIIFNSFIYWISMKARFLLFLLSLSTVFILANDFLLSLFIGSFRMSILFKVSTCLIALAPCCFFIQVKTSTLIYTSFFHHVYTLLNLLQAFLFFLQVETHIYSEFSHLSDLITEQSGVLILLHFEVALLLKLALQTAEYISTNQYLTFTEPHKVTFNLFYETINKELFNISWEHDSMVKIVLRKINATSYNITALLLHSFFRNQTLTIFSMWQVLLSRTVWICQKQEHSRYEKYSLMTISLAVKFALLNGLQFVIQAACKILVTVFHWKKNLLASLIPVLFQDSFSQEHLQQNSLIEWCVVILSIAIGVCFLPINSLTNDTAKRARDLCTPFLVYFLIFEESNAISKFLCLNTLLSFVADLGQMLKDL